MYDTDKITHILTYRNRPDLARAIRGRSYELNQSMTYGSRWHSILTSVEIYAPIYKHELLQKLTEEDKKEIIRAFHVLYPVRDDDIEIHHIEFLIDPDTPIPLAARRADRARTWRRTVLKSSYDCPLFRLVPVSIGS